VLDVGVAELLGGEEDDAAGNRRDQRDLAGQDDPR
jgi:hypothetical protein